MRNSRINRLGRLVESSHKLRAIKEQSAYGDAFPSDYKTILSYLEDDVMGCREAIDGLEEGVNRLLDTADEDDAPLLQDALFDFKDNTLRASKESLERNMTYFHAHILAILRRLKMN